MAPETPVPDESAVDVIPPLSASPAAKVFAGGGQAGRQLAAINWRRHPLGAIEGWPQSLRTSLSLCLASRYPICILWGPDRIYLYNDAYTPIVGGKHPRAQAARYPEVWPEIWESSIRPMLETVERTGEASWSDDILLVLERHGFPEECYFSFSFAPIRVEDGSVGGVFTAITETTPTVVGERRLRTLRDLGARAHEGKSAADAGRLAVAVLADNPSDIPFALLYLLDADGRGARLAAAQGFSGAPAEVELPESRWGFSEVLRTGTPRVVNGGPFPGGRWPEPATRAVVHPLARAGEAAPYGFLVAGCSPRRSFDKDYQDFFGLVAGHLATAVANAQAYEEERRRSEALAEIDRVKTDFFSNVSHEFRTPLTLLLGPLEDALQSSGTIGPEDRARIETAHRNGLRLLKLVNTLLDFSRIEAGRVQASYEPTDLSSLTRELASVFRSAVEAAGLRLRVDCPPLPEAVWVDREMWEKIVLNLLSNAFKFTFEGEIAVRLGWTGSGAELEVRDTGTGIPADELPNLFRRFHRVRGVRSRSHEGSGIGLALIHELIRLHGGRVDVDSEAGKGSVFRVRIPAGNGHLPKDRVQAVRSAASTAVGSSPFVQEALRWLPEPAVGVAPDVAPRAETADFSKRVLLADDNADMRSYVAGLLRRRWTVETAPDGAAALERIRACPPDVLLTDVMMPGLDGFGLIRAVRADAQLRELPVIVLSARAGEEARVEGLAAGADDYLVKPFGASELIARVAAQLRMRAVREASGREVREAKLRYELAMRATSELVWDFDTVRGRAVWNGALRDTAGVDGEESVMSVQEALAWWLDRIHSEDRERVHAGFKKAMQDGAEGWSAEYRFRKADGAYLHVLHRAAISRGADGAGVRMVGSMLDITDRKRVEEAGRRLAEELEIQVRERTRELREALEELQAFSYSVAHDLRAPLRAMHSYADLLAGEVGSALHGEGLDYVRRIAEASRRMDRLIMDLLDYSQSSLKDLAIRSVDVEAVAREAGRDLFVQAGPSAPALEIESPLPPVRADEVLLTQVLANLLSNAVKFGRPGVPVRVRVGGRACGETVRLWVEDNGIGIEPAHRDRIFRIFERLRPEEYPGTGIGLAIVRRSVARLGGRLGVEAVEDGGSRFWVELPGA